MSAYTTRLAGFTLIEMIAVIVVLGIMAAAVVPIGVTWVGAYNSARTATITSDKLRYAVERLARELREAQPETLNMSTTQPSFTRTTHPTGTRVVTIGQSGSNVTLSYDSPVVSPAPVLTDQLSALSFAYFDENGASTAVAGNVRYIQLSLTLEEGGNSVNQRTRVRIRNTS